MVEKVRQIRLARELGLGAALAIGIGTMVGAGIFILPGIAAAKTGPGVLLSFLTCSVIAISIALCMAELATALPQASVGYIFIARAFGPLVGSMMGWGLWLSLIFASAFYILGFGEYIASFLPLKPWIPALFVTAFLIFLNYRGVKKAGGFQNGIVAGLLAILIVFSIVGIFKIEPANFKPFLPFGKASVFQTSALLFITFMGFAQIADAAEEIKKPHRNIPLALVGSVIVVTVIYMGVVSVIVGLLRYDNPLIKDTMVMVTVAKGMAGGAGAAGIFIGAILATVSSANASILAASRANFAMARDGLMDSWLNKVHQKFRTPYRSLLLTGIIIMLILPLGDARLAAALHIDSGIEFLAEVAGFLSLLLYALVAGASMIMRYARVKWYKPTFRTPLFPFIPLLGVVGIVSIIINTGRPIFFAGMSLLVLSGAWYLLLRRGKVLVKGILGPLFKEKMLMPAAAQVRQMVGKGRPRVLIPLSNPATEESLVKLGAAFVKKEGELIFIHVIPVPEQISLHYAKEHFEKERIEKDALLETAISAAEALEVKAGSYTLLGRKVFSSILSVAREETADFVLMGWRGAIQRAKIKRASVSRVLKSARTHVLILKDRGLENVKRILVPSGGGPHARLSIHTASMLAKYWDAKLTILRVVKGKRQGKHIDDFEKKSLKLFDGIAGEQLQEEAEELGVEGKVKVVAARDIAAGVISEAANYDLLVIGASNEWIMKRRLFGSIPDKIANSTDCSVLMVRAGRQV